MKFTSINLLTTLVACVSISSTAYAKTTAATKEKEVAVKEETTAKKVELKESPKKGEDKQKSAQEVTPEPVVAPKLKPIVYGYKEWVWVVKPEVVLRAKLDTGAKTCSIHATNIEKIEIDGKKWVQFTISEPQDKKGPRLRYKAPLLRVSKIKNDTGGLDERFVVPLTFQIGDRKLVGEFNLNDRSEMLCSLLIGRNILEKIGYVDASRTDILEKPEAKKAKKAAKTKK